MPEIVDRLAASLSDRYRVERELGAGGMATVYLAEDKRHRRQVAIKVLHPELSAVLGTDRFLKEIELTASLQHPHILPLFDSGAADGLLYYVMPYVQGESLRSRLSRDKQLPIADAVRLATEVASALDYAHRRNVVHRDIKPENILLHDGQALVADFGIALAVQQAGGSRMTQTGMSLGTPQYMSPEQAMGEREISPRSDLYALGCVIYEMLTGEPPFTGPTAQAIVARVMTEDPRPIGSQRKTVPPHVEEAVLTALAKLPADRFASAAELAAALTDKERNGRSVGRATLARGPARIPSLPLLLGVLMLGLLAGAGAARLIRRPVAQDDAPVARFRIALPENEAMQVSAFGGYGAPVLLRDGSAVIYEGPRDPGGTQLWLRPLDRLNARPIPGTLDGAFPFVAPDGRSVGYFAPGPSRSLFRAALKVSPLDGSPGRTLIEDAGPWGADWATDGKIYYSGPVRGSSEQDGIYRVLASGGDPDLVARPDSGPENPSYRTVNVLPGGKGLLVTRWQRDSANIAVVSLATGKAQVLFRGNSPRFLAGYLIFVRENGVLHAAPFDESGLLVTGPPVPLLEGVYVFPPRSMGYFTIAESGTLFYVAGAAAPADLVWVDRTGAETALDPSNRLAFQSVRLSSDGKQLAYSASIRGGKSSGWRISGSAPGREWLEKAARTCGLRGIPMAASSCSSPPVAANAVSGPHPWMGARLPTRS